MMHATDEMVRAYKDAFKAYLDSQMFTYANPADPSMFDEAVKKGLEAVAPLLNGADNLEREQGVCEECQSNHRAMVAKLRKLRELAGEWCEYKHQADTSAMCGAKVNAILSAEPVKVDTSESDLPEGYALVPIEPTVAMINAGSYWNTECDSEPEYEALHSIWRDMIAAAKGEE